MSNYTFGETRTYLPEEDLVGKEGYAIKMGTSGGGDVDRSCRVCTDWDDFVGVLLYSGNTFDATTSVSVTTKMRSATVQTSGTVRAIAQAQIVNGQAVTVHTDGRFRPASGEPYVGFAETDASGAGKSFQLRLTGLRPTAA